MKELTTRLQQLEEKDPVLAETLAGDVGCRFSTTFTRKNEPNLSYQSQGKTLYLHSNYSAEKEAVKWFESLDLDGARTLYLYGLGLGYALGPLSQWLEADSRRMVVFLEEELEVIKAALVGPFGEMIATHSQVMLVPLSDTDGDQQAVAGELTYYFVGVPFKVSALPHYDMQRSDSYNRLRMHIMHSAAHVGFVSKEFLDYGAAFFRNFYINLLRLPEMTRCGPLLGAFEGVPAIICGAGPSLNKNFATLETLRDHALIFAGGSAVNALRSRGLEPHFGGSVDPNPLQAERMAAHSAFNMPTFTKGRVFFKALETLHGPKLYLTGNNGYPITKWFEQRLGIDDPEMIEGHNVLHLLIDIARNLGCSPIVFVGMDLAYSGLEQYAAGVVADNVLSKDQITKASNINDNAFLRKDINGEPVYTLWKWVAESDYTSHYARLHRDTQFVNCTEGGLGFEGIDNRTLKEVADQACILPRDFDSEIHALLQMGHLTNITHEQVLGLMKEVGEGLCRSVVCAEKIEGHLKELIKRVKQNQIGRIQRASEKIQHEQSLLDEEMVYKQLLEPVNHIRSNLFDRKLSEIDRDNGSELQRMLDRCDANRREMETVRECAQVNGTIMELAVKEFERQGNDVSGFREEHE